MFAGYLLLAHLLGSTGPFLKEIPTASNKRRVKAIVDLVDDLERRECELKDRREVEHMERELEALVQESLEAVSM